MKFDPSKVLTTVAELCDPRFSGPDGAIQLAEFLSTRFAGTGWGPQRIEASIPADRPVSPRDPVIVARRPLENLPSVRVLIHAPLGNATTDGFRPRLSGYLKGLLGRKAGSDADPAPPLTPADVGGLAMALELARAWPKAWSRRLELVLAVTIGQPPNTADADAIAREFDPVRTGIATLVVPLFAPGLGRELILLGGRSRELAMACAASLWIPVSPSGSKTLPRGFWPAAMSQTFPDHVALIGGDIDGESPATLDADALRRTADLVAEIALRWAKQGIDQSGAGADSRRDARSSQNPG